MCYFIGTETGMIPYLKVGISGICQKENRGVRRTSARAWRLAQVSSHKGLSSYVVLYHWHGRHRFIRLRFTLQNPSMDSTLFDRAGYTKIHFYSISESSWNNFDYMICPLSEPRRHVCTLSYREEPSIIYFISRL